MKQEEANLSEIPHGTLSTAPNIAPGEVIIGTVTEIDGQGKPLVDYYGNPANKAQVALSTHGITRSHIGRQVALLFANGDPRQPLIIGLIHSPLQEMLETYEVSPTHDAGSTTETISTSSVNDVMLDGKRIVLEGKEEIVLKCGEASITLTRAGKILIRGKYLLNRASGVNRIMGGSVQVN